MLLRGLKNYPHILQYISKPIILDEFASLNGIQ